jgi:hypothetical protein
MRTIYSVFVDVMEALVFAAGAGVMIYAASVML